MNNQQKQRLAELLHALDKVLTAKLAAKEEQTEPARPHQELIDAMNQHSDALAFVRIGVIDGEEYFVYVTDPQWKEDKSYLVTNRFSKKEAVEYSREIFEEFIQKGKKKNEQIRETQKRVSEAFEKTMAHLESHLITETELGHPV
jgi:hypothetical protein